MYLEEVHVFEDRQSHIFYGPFDSEQSREIFKNFTIVNHKLFWATTGAAGIINNIKHISVDSLPEGEYKQFPMSFAGIFMWISPEDFENAHKIQIAPNQD